MGTPAPPLQAGVVAPPAAQTSGISQGSTPVTPGFGTSWTDNFFGNNPTGAAVRTAIPHASASLGQQANSLGAVMGQQGGQYYNQGQNYTQNINNPYGAASRAQLGGIQQGESGLGSYYQNILSGQGTTPAQLQYQQAQDQSIAAQMAMAHSAGGGAAGQAGAERAAQQAGGQQMAGAAAQSGLIQAQDMEAAAQGQAALYGQQGQQALGQYGLENQIATANQAQQNQQQLGYGALANQSNANQAGLLNSQAQQALGWGQLGQQGAQNTFQNGMQLAGAGLGAAAGVAGAAGAGGGGSGGTDLSGGGWSPGTSTIGGGVSDIGGAAGAGGSGGGGWVSSNVGALVGGPNINSDETSKIMDENNATEANTTKSLDNTTYSAPKSAASGGSALGTAAQVAGMVGTAAMLFSDERAKEKVDERSMEGASMPVDGRRTVADDFLDHMHPHSYEYKDPGKEPREIPTGGQYLGIMAQDAERVPGIGHQLVMDTPSGKVVSTKSALSAALAGVGRLNERLRVLEGMARGGDR